MRFFYASVEDLTAILACPSLSDELRERLVYMQQVEARFDQEPDLEVLILWRSEGEFRCVAELRSEEVTTERGLERVRREVVQRASRKKIARRA